MDRCGVSSMDLAQKNSLGGASTQGGEVSYFYGKCIGKHRRPRSYPALALTPVIRVALT